MCGIAGRVNRSRPVLREEIFRMTAALEHRGPDDCGYHLRPRVGLGHRRLSIIDLEGGKQPLANEDGSVWIVFNGEVYNHVELRRELQRCGHSFQTHSDTEAIVHAYEEWGLDCVSRLRGMFAFAIWDEHAGRLMLARDRLGIKPLYYSLLGGDLAFASEMKALTLLSEVDRDIDDRAFDAYLTLRYVPAPLTMLRGVRKLPPGHVLTFRAGEVSINRYWDLADAPIDPVPPTEVEAAFELRSRIDDATRMRLMSEVPLGAFLSGGIDSAFITSSMKKERRTGAIDTFSVGFSNSDCDDQADDELAAARSSALSLGTVHHELRISEQEVQDELPRILWHLDEPIADTAAIPLYFLSRHAKSHVTVVLSGEGADEALGGYGMYARMLRIENLKRSGRGVWENLSQMAGLLPSGRVKRAVSMLSPLETNYRGISRAFDGDLAKRLTGRDPIETARQLLAPHWERTRDMSPLRRMLYLDCNVWLPDDLLAKADKMTMAHGLELRVPFLDHQLIEYAWSLPDEMKVQGGVGKQVLRRAAQGRLPEEILTRKKRGFTTPARAWLSGAMRASVEDLLRSSDGLARERLSRREVERLLDDHAHGANLTSELWALYCLEVWHRQLPPAVSREPLLRIAPDETEIEPIALASAGANA